MGPAQARLQFHLEQRNAAVVLCDRGTVDGIAYWPGDPGDFLDELDTSVDFPTKARRALAAIGAELPPCCSPQVS